MQGSLTAVDNAGKQYTFGNGVTVISLSGETTQYLSGQSTFFLAKDASAENIYFSSYSGSGLVSTRAIQKISSSNGSLSLVCNSAACVSNILFGNKGIVDSLGNLYYGVYVYNNSGSGNFYYTARLSGAATKIQKLSASLVETTYCGGGLSNGSMLGNCSNAYIGNGNVIGFDPSGNVVFSNSQGLMRITPKRTGIEPVRPVKSPGF